MERQREKMCKRQSINEGRSNISTEFNILAQTHNRNTKGISSMKVVDKIITSTVNGTSVFSTRDIYDPTTSRRSMIIMVFIKVFRILF